MPPIVVPTFTMAPPPPAPPPAPPVATLDPAPQPVCVLTAHDVELARSMPLRVEDSAPFLHLDQARTVEVRLASPRSTARASRSDLDVVGHVKLSDVPVRPRSDALVDGWLRVRHAALRDGDPARLQLEVATPWFVKPVKEPVVAVTCDDISIASEIERPDPPAGKAVDLREGVRIDLRASPGGPVVATLSIPKPEPDEAHELIETYQVERRGEQVRVRIEGDGTDVEGWVSRRDVVSPPAQNLLGMLGAMSRRRGAVALTGEAPLLVRTNGRMVRVGTARPGTLPCGRSQAAAGAGAIVLDLLSPFAELFGTPTEETTPVAAELLVAPVNGETCVDREPARP